MRIEIRKLHLLSFSMSQKKEVWRVHTLYDVKVILACLRLITGHLKSARSCSSADGLVDVLDLRPMRMTSALLL